MSLPISYSPAVAQARANGDPIVALESTIITHGMPFPQNIETALAVEQIIIDAGATPATIAVSNHVVHVGHTTAELTALAQQQDAKKISRSDIAHCIQAGYVGATTVAATMTIAHLANIAVFATGGIGGVHRGAEHSFDVSADLYELAITPVSVVAAGAKAILDIPKTVEVLESHGVPLMAYRADFLPAFWSSTSTISAPLRVDTPQEIAKLHQLRGMLGFQQGQLIANPIAVSDEIPLATMERLITAALQQADDQGIQGKAVTPFLLAKLNDLSHGKTLQANIALVKNNAALAADIAIALLKI